MSVEALITDRDMRKRAERFATQGRQPIVRECQLLAAFGDEGITSQRETPAQHVVDRRQQRPRGVGDGRTQVLGVLERPFRDLIAARPVRDHVEVARVGQR